VGILIASVVLTGLGVLALLVLVLAGIRAEERHMSLTSTPGTCIEAATRRLLGVGVRNAEAHNTSGQIPPGSDRP
jgi:hypothetical protein